MPLNEYPTTETKDENCILDINRDVNSEEIDPPILNIGTINDYIDCIKLYDLQRKDKKCSNELLQLANQMQNVIFNECESYTQVCMSRMNANEICRV